MRVGQNPRKFTKSAIPRPRISAGVVTHCTGEAYHSNRLDIVRSCLNSIMAAYPDEFIIWDNGSTPEFREMLRSFRPNVLIEADNVGLDTAKHNLLNIARGEIFCYSDDDILHAAGWLDKQMEILETYPDVGVVSGSPQRSHFKFAVSTNGIRAAEYNMSIKTGKLIPDEYEQDYAASIGIEYSALNQSTISVQDTLLEYKGVKAWAHGHHMQFTCYREKVKTFFPASNFYMSRAQPMDEAMNAAGLMRLTTYQRTCRHLGNVV